MLVIIKNNNKFHPKLVFTLVCIISPRTSVKYLLIRSMFKEDISLSDLKLPNRQFWKDANPNVLFGLLKSTIKEHCTDIVRYEKHQNFVTDTRKSTLLKKVDTH